MVCNKVVFVCLAACFAVCLGLSKNDKTRVTGQLEKIRGNLNFLVKNSQIEIQTRLNRAGHEKMWETQDPVAWNCIRGEVTKELSKEGDLISQILGKIQSELDHVAAIVSNADAATPQDWAEVEAFLKSYDYYEVREQALTQLASLIDDIIASLKPTIVQTCNLS